MAHNVKNALLRAGAKEQVSIQCCNGPPGVEHWIRFDDFRILQLPATGSARARRKESLAS